MPMKLAERFSAEDWRRGYGSGAVSANQYRASLGFQDVGARRGAMQILDARNSFAEQQTRDTAAATERMRIQADASRPMVLAGGGVAVPRPGGQVQVWNPPPVRPAPMVLRPSESVLDPAAGRIIATAPPAPAEPPQPRYMSGPGGSIWQLDGAGGGPAKMVVGGPAPEVDRAESYYGPVLFDHETNTLREWSPRGGRFGAGGYEVKPIPNGGLTYEGRDSTGAPFVMRQGGVSLNTKALPRWADRERGAGAPPGGSQPGSQPGGPVQMSPEESRRRTFAAVFLSVNGRAPTAAEVAAARGVPGGW